MGADFLSGRKIASHPQLYSKFIKKAHDDERDFSYPNEHYTRMKNEHGNNSAGRVEAYLNK
jgi:hypothetical protein